jgi:hypothetical protein
MTQQTCLGADGADPRKILGLIFAGMTIYGMAKGRKTHPVAALSAVLTVIAYLSD